LKKINFQQTKGNAMSLSGLVLGLINIAIVVVVLLLLGAIVLWFCGWLSFPVPANIQKLYMAIVALVALYMLAALILGIPSIRVIGNSGHPIGATVGSVPNIITDGRR
jgi:hypothetical protein